MILGFLAGFIIFVGCIVIGIILFLLFANAWKEKL